MLVITANNSIFTSKLLISKSDSEDRVSTDPDAVLGRDDDPLWVGGALGRTRIQLFLKGLFEEFVGGGFQQLDQV